MRIAESVRTKIVLGIAIAVVATSALALRSHAEVPVEPYVHCVIPDITPPVVVALENSCERIGATQLSAQAPRDVGRAPADATVTASGLRYRGVMPPCNGARPRSGDRAEVRYAGWTSDGKPITQGVETGSLPVDAVIPGFSEGLQLMHVGDRVRLWIPGNLAYDRGASSRASAPHGTLTFDIELVAITAGR